MTEWLYFGCGREAGHYLFGQDGQKRYRREATLYDKFNHFDGTLPPQPETRLYLASFSVLGGWDVCALSWWDRSVDKRSASNSTIFAPGLGWRAEPMLEEARVRFPWVFNRLPAPLALLGSGAA